MHLTYDDQRLTGTIDGLPVEVDWDRWHRAQVSGVFAGSELSAAWRLNYSSAEPPDIDATLRGSFGDQVVTLTGEFQLDDYYAIHQAWISGQIDGQPIRATVEALDGGFDDGQGGTIAVEGRFAGTALALAATISMDLRAGMIRGTIDNIPVLIDATRPAPPRGMDRDCCSER